MRPLQIFISYRRDDAAGYARAIGEGLGQAFGSDRVFIDVDDIHAGQPFDSVIAQAVGSAEVLLVLIGPRWRGERPGQPARLDDPEDFVHREVAGALAKNMHVVPLLLDGTPMPDAEQLPRPLKALARRNALELRNTRFASDMQQLIGDLRALLGEVAVADPAAASLTAVAQSPVGPTAPPPPQAPAARTGLWLAVAAGVATALGIGGWQARQRQAPPVAPHPPTASSPAPGALPAAATARPAINGRWQADVRYGWPGADYTERFEFIGEGTALNGSASFLKVPRGLLQGSIRPDGLVFITQTAEVSGSASSTLTHRYQGTLVGEELRFVMQTEGGDQARAPVQFVARRQDLSRP